MKTYPLRSRPPRWGPRAIAARRPENYTFRNREPVGGAHRNPEAAATALEKYLTTAIDDLKRLRLDSLVRRRQERIRNLGAFFDDPKPPDAKSKRKDGQTRKLTSRASRLNTRLRMAMKVAG